MSQAAAVQSEGSAFDSWYTVGFVITFIITFSGCWLYCIASYGFLLGVSLGWFPAAICAVIAGTLWPLIAILVCGAAFFIFTH